MFYGYVGTFGEVKDGEEDSGWSEEVVTGIETFNDRLEASVLLG